MRAARLAAAVGAARRGYAVEARGELRAAGRGGRDRERGKAGGAGAEDEFRVLDFLKRRQRVERPVQKREPVPPPRTVAMSTTQQWGSVWPGPRTFHPASVPLSMRQGFPLRGQAPPGPLANAELMKIPNFLHLTPPAVKAHCLALRQFCTPWPANLDEQNIQRLFPLEIITSDYCHSGPTIRDPLSRIVSIRINLSSIPLDDHAMDKLRRLVGDRYDEKTNVLTIVTDRCPTKKQNLEYAVYLLTALYHESWTVEPWEKEKTEADMEVYIWENNQSKKAAIDLHNWKPDKKSELSEDDYNNYDLSAIPKIDGYRAAVSELINEGENSYQMDKYKRAVLELLGLPIPEQLTVSESNRSK